MTLTYHPKQPLRTLQQAGQWSLCQGWAWSPDCPLRMPEDVPGIRGVRGMEEPLYKIRVLGGLEARAVASAVI